MNIYIPEIGLLYIAILIACVVVFAFMMFYFWNYRRKQKFSPFTEDSLRLPGHSLRLKQSDISDYFLLPYLQFFPAFVGMLYSMMLLKGSLKFPAIALLIVYVAYLLRIMWKNFDGFQKCRLGREGEEYTGQELNLLMRSGAFVFHDLPYKYGNIDHIVVGNNKIFVVETKAVRKPRSKDSNSRESEVAFDGEALKFPNFTTTKPVTQALRHAKYLSDILDKKCGVNFPVIAVIALPGWFIQSNAKSKNNNILVINPRRGAALRNWIGDLDDKESRDKVVAYIASVARSANFSSDKTDPDASKKYDFWLNPRVKEISIGD